MADGRVVIFTGDPAVAVPVILPVGKYGQVILYIEIVAIGPGGFVDVTPQMAEDAVDFRGYQILRPALVPDQNPPTYTVRYTTTGVKAALLMPLACSDFRVLVEGDGGDVDVLAQLAFVNVEGLGT